MCFTLVGGGGGVDLLDSLRIVSVIKLLYNHPTHYRHNPIPYIAKTRLSSAHQNLAPSVKIIRKVGLYFQDVWLAAVPCTCWVRIGLDSDRGSGEIEKGKHLDQGLKIVETFYICRNTFCWGLWKLTRAAAPFNNQNVYSRTSPLPPGLREVSEYLNISPFARISSLRIFENQENIWIHRQQPPPPQESEQRLTKSPLPRRESIRGRFLYTSLLIISFTVQNSLIQKVGKKELQLYELV